MKIAIDGMLLSRCRSGVEGSILHLVKALARFGQEEYVLHAPSEFDGRTISDGRVQIVKTRLPVKWRPIRILWQQLGLPFSLRRHSAGLLHSPAYIAPAVPLPVPLVLTVYDLIALRFPALSRSSNVLHYNLLLPHSIKHAARIIVPSECTKRDLVSLVPVVEERIRVIPLGVGEEFRVLEDTAHSGPVLARHGISGKFLLFVGRREPKKNLPRLLKAFHILKTEARIPHKLVIAGELGWGEAETMDALNQLGLKQDVIFTGFIPPEDLPSLYSAADLFVFPSLYEGFGLPPLEAMACGVPVICSNRGALPEITGNAAMLADPDIPCEFAQAMKQVLQSPELRHELIKRGIRQACRFSWEHAARLTDEIYREAVTTP